MKKNYVIAVSTVNPANGNHQLKLFQEDSETNFNSSSVAPYIVIRNAPSLEYVLAETFLYRPTAPRAHYKYGEEVFKGVEGSAVDNVKFKFDDTVYPPSVDILKLGELVRLNKGETAIPYLLVPNWLDLGVLSRKVTLLPMHYRHGFAERPNNVTDQLLTLLAANQIPVAVR